jgi:hypothetical protein
MRTYDDLYRRHAEHQGFEWQYLKALAVVSTREDENAVRCGHGERRYFQRRMRGRAPWRDARHDEEAMASRYGLMSLPYHGAVECGWDLARCPGDLLDPETNIRYAAAYLASRMARYASNISPALAAYHSSWGIAQLVDGGHFSCQPFVDRVCRLAEKIRASQMPQDARPLACVTH